MTNKNLKSILFTGTIVAGSLLGTNVASAHQTNPFNFTDLGSGSQLRTTLLENLTSSKYRLDISCGEKTKDNSKNENKSKDAKCGEGKCGDSKAKEQKCGGKNDSTMQSKTMKKADDKSKEGKCGEGKCGEGKCGDKNKTDKK